MVTDELIEYVRQQLAAGHNKDGLRTLLVANGWQEKDVNDAYTAVDKAPSAKPATAKKSMKKSEVTLFIILLIVLLAAGAYWYLFLRTSTDTTQVSVTTPTPTVKPTATPNVIAAALALPISVPTQVAATNVQLTYTKRDQSGTTDPTYTVSAEGTQGTTCAAQTLTLTPSLTKVTYQCGASTYELELEPTLSDANTLTLAVSTL